jgi:hypothetical protein
MKKIFKLKDKKITVESDSEMSYTEIKTLLHKLADSSLLKEESYGYAWIDVENKIYKASLKGNYVEFGRYYSVSKELADKAIDKPFIKVEDPVPFAIQEVTIILSKDLNKLKDKIFDFMKYDIN